jgi:hypothetical protein
MQTHKFTAFLFLLLIALQAAWFHHLYQGVYYFALLTILIYSLRKLVQNGLRAPLSFAWLAVWFDSIGNYYDWYGNINNYDDFSHMIVAAAIVFIFFYIFIHLKLSSPFAILSSRNIAVSGAFLMSAFLMSLYEVLEFYLQRVSGIRFIWGEFDTTLDLQWNIIGAIAGGLAIFCIDKVVLASKRGN